MEKTIVISVDYVFDENRAWQESYIKRDIVTVPSESSGGDSKAFDEAIKDHIRKIDGVSFPLSTDRQEIFVDGKEDGEPRQVGWIYRFYSEIFCEDGKYRTYRGDAWVHIYGELIPHNF